MASNKNYMLDDKFPRQIKNATSTSDGLMSAEDKARMDELFEYGVFAPVSPDNDGIMTKDDKLKLDGIEANANNYIHPDTPEIRHVTDAQIAYWNAKASTDVATQTSNGLMSAEDKKKLNGIEANANNYIHPVSHPATMIVEDSDNRFVTDAQIAYWNAKASTAVATQTSNGLMSATDKIKLDGIENNANNYTHPNTHPATMIVGDVTHRFVTDEQINYWNNKASVDVTTPTGDGLMSAEDKKKLDGIEANANNYIHPDTPNIRHVTDVQINYWNAKASTDVATKTSNGLMSAEDNTLLYDLLDRVINIEELLKHAVYYG